MKALEELQYQFVCDLRTGFHDYEAGMYAHRLVTPQGRYRDALRCHLARVRETLARVEDLAEATLREVLEEVRRRSTADYDEC